MSCFVHLLLSCDVHSPVPPQEKFSQFPPWISHTTSSYRHALIVAPAAAQDRSLPAVIDHIHAWHLLEPGTQQKLNPRKVGGWVGGWWRVLHIGDVLVAPCDTGPPAKPMDSHVSHRLCTE
jgi:hypothetical protein